MIDVELEILKRKYEVDIDALKQVLKSHKKNCPIQEIADILDVPLTMVQHWFRTDKYFSVPPSEYWFQIKELLCIETDEFDESIMTYIADSGNYDLRNRIYDENISPTLTTNSETYLYLLPIKSNEDDTD